MNCNLKQLAQYSCLHCFVRILFSVLINLGGRKWGEVEVGGGSGGGGGDSGTPETLPWVCP